jgi:hypothetical protein
MGKRTVLNGENLSLGTGSVVFAFQTAAAGSAASGVHLTRFELTQNPTTAIAGCRGEFFTRDTAGTLTLTSKAPTPHQPITGSASGLAGNANVLGGVARSGINSSADSGGTYANSIPFNFMNLNGYMWKPDGYGEEIIVPPSTVFGMRFIVAPGATTGWTFTAWLDERG